MKAERKDQAAKLRELALEETRVEPSLHDEDGAVAVLELEPETQERPMAVEPAVEDKAVPQTLSDSAEKDAFVVHENHKPAKKKDAVIELPKKEPGGAIERITMDLPVYSPEDAAKVMLPSKKKENQTVTEKPNGELRLEVVKETVSENKPDSVKVDHPKKIETLPTLERFTFETTTQVIAVSGGKGGVGKSNIACNMGIAFSRMGKNVLLMDADMSLANIDILLGMTPKYNIAHVISGEKEVNEVIIPGPGGMKILPGGSGVEELAHLSPESMSRLFHSFAKLKPVPDIFILDTAAGIHPNVMQFVLAADQVIVVTTPEPTAYVDAYALIKTLVHHDADKEISLLINMARDSREALHVIRLLLQLCRTALKTGFNNLGYIPKDEEVSKSVRSQQAFLLRSPNCPASKALRNIASTVLQIEPKMEKGQGITGFFKRLFASRHPDKKAAES